MVIPGPIDRTTGGTIYDRRIIEAARAAGDDVTVVSLPGAFPAPLRRADRNLCRAELQRLPNGATVCIDGLVLASLQRELIRLAQRCDMIVLMHHPTSEEPGLSARRRRHLRRAESAVLRSALRVICTSRFTARLLTRRGIEAARVAVVAPGVDTESARAACGDKGQLLCVANLIERKGIDYLLQALAEICDLDWRLTIVGSTDLEPQTAARLRRQAEELAIESRVLFAGVQSAAGLERLYAAAGLFVLPSLYEGYGMVLAEAAAYSLPIVTTDGGAIPDTVSGLGAMVVPAASSSALAAALRRFLSDSDFRGRLQQRAQAARSDLRSWTQAAAEFRQQLCGPAAEGRGGFDRDWLLLREQADHAARDRALTDRLLDSLVELRPDTSRPLRVLDLAAGTGSTLRFLAPHLPLPQIWTLYDIDRPLLEYGESLCRSWIGEHGLAGRVDVAFRVADLGRMAAPGDSDRSGLLLKQDTPADLVTASALFDLVSRNWLEELIDSLRQMTAVPALLAGVIYNGALEFTPADTDDRLVIEAFHRDMQRDKGFGEALGPVAAGAAGHALLRAGFEVFIGDSTWRLADGLAGRIGRTRFNALLSRQLEFFADAAQCAGIDADRWLGRRREQLREGALSIVVGHSDILALPPAAGGA